MMDDQSWIVTIPFAAIYKRIPRLVFFCSRWFHQDHLIVLNVSELLTADNCMEDALTFEVKANSIKKHIICHRSFMWLNSCVRIRSLNNRLNHFIRFVLFEILWLLCMLHSVMVNSMIIKTMKKMSRVQPKNWTMFWPSRLFAQSK